MYMNKNGFFYQAHCENGHPSSKRLYGGIGFMIIQLCICVYVIIGIIRGDSVTGLYKDFFFFDLSISATLLGLSTLTSVFNGNSVSASNCEHQNTKKKKDEETDEEIEEE